MHGDGEEIPADVILFGTGYQKDIPTPLVSEKHGREYDEITWAALLKIFLPEVGFPLKNVDLIT